MPGCADSRRFPFGPGNRPERFEKAIRSGADAVVLDLEDSVPLAAAREAITSAWPALRRHGLPLVVRMNPADTEAGGDDLRWLRQLAALSALMVPKLCIHPAQVAAVRAVFAPSAAELAWARRVLADDRASGGATVRRDGRMIDPPVVLRARRVLQLERTTPAAGTASHRPGA